MYRYLFWTFSDLWDESQTQKKNSKRKTSDPFNPDRRRKPVTITGPYIVYMIKDVDIIDDWTAIKKVHSQAQLFLACALLFD